MSQQPETIIRASSLSGYPDCPRRSAARMFRKEIEGAGYTLNETPRGIGAAVGSAIHAAAAYTLSEKATSGILAPMSAAVDAAVESVREATRQGVMFDKITADANRAEQTAARMTLSYCAYIAPSVEPVLIEKRLEASVGDGLILSGQSDLIAREKDAVRDLKSGSRRGAHKPQIGSYSLLARSHGMTIQTAREDFVRRVGPRTEQPMPVSYVHDVGAAETAAVSILRHIKNDLKTFREGAEGIMPGDTWAFAANPSSVLCSAKYCPAYGTNWCHEWKSQETE